MILGFNLIGFIATILPPFIFALVIFLTSPRNSLSLRKIPSFIIGGAFSVIFLKILNFLFPYDINILINAFDDSFFYTAPREEISKFISFIICFKFLHYKKQMDPISFMYYFSIIGLGFALIENIYYVGQHGVWVMKVRLFGATLVHMICGFLFGYWIGLGKIQTKRNKISSLLIHSPKTKSVIYTIVGLLFAIIFHGIWNHTIQIFNLSSTPLLVSIIFIGITMCKFLSSDLLSKQKLT